MAGNVSLENTNQIFYAADLTIRSKMSFLALIRDKFRKNENRDLMFRETCFGHWLDIPYTDNEPALVNLILQTQIPVNPDVHEENQPLIYQVSGFNLEFGREQFCLITGLPFGPMDWEPYLRGEIPFRDRVFGHVESPSITLYDFTSLFHSERFDDLSDEDATRVCLVICLELIFNGREHTSVVRNNILRIVEDINAWNACPWGSYVWSTTYACIRNGIFNRMANRVLKAGPPTTPKFTFGGFIWAFKIWILETFAAHVRCWEHDYAFIPRALAWRKQSTFHVNEDATPLLSSINNLNPPIHPIRPKDNELAQEWYISSTRFFNGDHGVHPPPLRDNGDHGVHPPPGRDHGVRRPPVMRPIDVTVEERLVALESISKEMQAVSKEIQADILSLKNRVLVIEQKVQDYTDIEDEDEDDDWHKIDELLELHQNHMKKKDQEVDYSNNLKEFQNLNVSRSSIDEMVKKVDQLESRVDKVDTRAQSVYSYRSQSCEDILADNILFEDSANTAKSYCPQLYQDVQLNNTKAPDEIEETMYVLNKELIAEVLTQVATGVDEKKKLKQAREVAFLNAPHYKRFLAHQEAKKKAEERSNETWRRIREGRREYKKKIPHLKSVNVKGEPSTVRSFIPKSDFCKMRPVAPWVEDLKRDDPSKMYPVPSYQYHDLKRTAGLEGWRLSFSPDIILREPFWNALLCMNTGHQKGWLHDEHISMWVDYLNETRPPNADWCMVDGWFLTLLLRGDVSNLYGDEQRFKVSFGEVDRVLIPINSGETHWILGEFHIPTGVMMIYDSYHDWLSSTSNKVGVEFMIETVKQQLPLYLQRLGVFEKRGLEYSSYNITWDTFPKHLTPQQGPLYGDCGVFVCIFLYRLSHGLGLDVGDPIQAALAYRERMTDLALEYKERVYEDSKVNKLRNAGGKRKGHFD